MRKIQYEDNNIILDNGTYFGQGIFETILFLDSPILLEEHLNRLEKGMKILNLISLERETLSTFLNTLNIKNKAVKVVVTPENIIIKGREIPYNEEDYSKGKALKICEVRRNSTSKLNNVKWCGYYENILLKDEAIKAGYDDALFLNEKGVVCETTCANIFIIKNGRVLTPKIEDGLLGGIIREWIISNFNVIEKSITIEEVLESDEVFITNSLMGVMKVNKIENTLYEQELYTNMIRRKLGGLYSNGR